MGMSKLDVQYTLYGTVSSDVQWVHKCQALMVVDAFGPEVGYISFTSCSTVVIDPGGTGIPRGRGGRGGLTREVTQSPI